MKGLTFALFLKRFSVAPHGNSPLTLPLYGSILNIYIKEKTLDSVLGTEKQFIV